VPKHNSFEKTQLKDSSAESLAVAREMIDSKIIDIKLKEQIFIEQFAFAVNTYF
jgi:hypothetical protein